MDHDPQLHHMQAMREQTRDRRHIGVQRAAAASVRGSRMRLPSAGSESVRDSHLLDHAEWEQDWLEDAARAFEPSPRVFDPSRYPGYLNEPLAPQTGPALQTRTSRTTAPHPAIDLDANPSRARRDAIAFLTPVLAANVVAGPSRARRDVIASHTPVPATNVDAWLSTTPSDTSHGRLGSCSAEQLSSQRLALDWRAKPLP